MCRLSRSFFSSIVWQRNITKDSSIFRPLRIRNIQIFFRMKIFPSIHKALVFRSPRSKRMICLLITIFPFLTGFDQIEMTIWSDGFDCINFISHRFLIEKLLLLDQMHNLQRVIWNGIENINRIYFSLITSKTMFNIQGKFNIHLVFLKLRSSLERDRRIILSWIILEIHRVRSRGTLFGQHQRLMESKCETKFRAGCNSAWRGREENTH